MKMKCPHCGVKGSADVSLINRKVKCPKCQQKFGEQPFYTIAGSSQRPSMSGSDDEPAAELEASSAG